ncbi:MAG: CHASE domain-containing protein [Chromatiaceae bacterium]|jgi:signal transduction histidine kinase|nr:CHASE domain-containing protein [Chromatiaceae bacterium]
MRWPQAKVGEWLAEAAAFWRSYGPIFVVALLGALGTWLVSARIADLENQRHFAAFSEAARDRLLVIQRELDYSLGLVQDLGSFFDAASMVTRRQFREFVGPTLKRNRIIQSLQWAPRVTGDQRRDFAAKVRPRIPRFQVQDRAANGESRQAPERPVHFPILYVQPYPENTSLLGLDLAGIPRVMALLSKAAELRTLLVGEPEIRQDQDGESLFSIYRPVFTRVEEGEGLEMPNDIDAEPVGIEDQEVRGFAIGVFRFGELIDEAMASLGPSGVDIAFWSRDGTQKQHLFYVHRSRLRDEANGLTDSIATSYEGRVQAGDLTWTLVCTPVPGAFQTKGWGVWLIPLMGMVFTLLTCVYLLALTGRDRQVRRLVAERTLELSRANEALNVEIAERCRAEQAMQCLNMTLEHRVERRTFESERRARDLEQFAYVASHDLKAPLRGIANLAEWLKEDLQDRLTPETQEQLDLLRDRVARMNALIEGLLEYSRIGRVAGSLEEVDVGTLVAEVVDTLAPPSHFKVKIALGLPVLHTDRLHLSQVFANLIANAIRHHDRDRGWVRVSGQDEGDLWLFAIEDDGPGIPPEFQDKVFLMFQTLSVKDYGVNTGIGLALVKKLVEEHGGTIRLEDLADRKGKRRGCRFVFTWAKREQALDPGGDDVQTNRDLPR